MRVRTALFDHRFSLERTWSSPLVTLDGVTGLMIYVLRSRGDAPTPSWNGVRFKRLTAINGSLDVWVLPAQPAATAPVMLTFSTPTVGYCVVCSITIQTVVRPARATGIPPQVIVFTTRGTVPVGFVEDARTSPVQSVVDDTCGVTYWSADDWDAVSLAVEASNL